MTASTAPPADSRRRSSTRSSPRSSSSPRCCSAPSPCGAAARGRAADHRADDRRLVEMPGASRREVEERVTTADGEAALGDARRRVHLLHVEPGQSMVIVRFKVGEDEEEALVRLNQKLHANFDLIPPGAVGTARQAALDRRRADPGAHAVVASATATSSCGASPRSCTTPSSRSPTSPR